MPSIPAVFYVERRWTVRSRAYIDGPVVGCAYPDTPEGKLKAEEKAAEMQKSYDDFRKKTNPKKRIPAQG